ncbi:MAG TPA: hypothetical protein VFV05_06330, partial [Methylomirabilota bacterium]|nr:hypothetical protein [Methylomirabilota bacterium]
VVSDGRAEAREVTTGLEGPDRVEIARGLTGSERVVARGHEGLYAGARVSETPMAGGAAPGVPVAPAKPDATTPMPKKEGGHAGH